MIQQQPQQQAQARQPYTIDIFNTIPAEGTVNFTRTGDAVTIAADTIPAHTMSAATFDQYFKYYQQGNIFNQPATTTPSAGQISQTAAKLLKILQETDGAWENQIMYTLFERPQYPLKNETPAEEYTAKIRAYWQFDANMYGGTWSRPINHDSQPAQHEEFTKNIPTTYSRQLSAAYQELRAAGLADERNSGYNDYYFYPTTKGETYKF